jgi:hypothetical protein
MAVQASFWRRMSSLFHPGDGNTAVARSEPRLESGDTNPAPLSTGSHPPGLLWWRGPQRGAQVREVSLRLVELAHAMQEHFHQQDQRAAELAGALQRVGGILEQLADSQRSHGDYLRAIAEQTETAGKTASALTATLGRMPESLLAQAEAIRTVARSLEISQEADTQLMHSLQQFGRAVDTLGSSAGAQVDILQRLNAAQQEQHQAFTALVREQSRRFLAVFAVVVVVAVAALAGLVAMLVWRPGA